MKNTKNILVTGGAGYIGSHTVLELIKSGYNPVILDDFRNANDIIVSQLEKLCGQPLTFIRTECQDVPALRTLFQQYDFLGVIHFAADKAVGESVVDPLKYYDNNLNSLIVILRMMEEHGVRSLVFSSSSAVYGSMLSDHKGSEVNITEDTEELKPGSPYGYTKLVCEHIIKDWIASVQGYKAVLLRYFNPIGADVSGEIGEFPQGIPNNLLPYITQTAKGIREELTVFGNDYETEDGTCVRDYIHVTDLAKAHVASLDWLNRQEGTIVDAFNIGTGKGTSVLEIIEAFQRVVDAPLNWKFGPKRPGDVPVIYANASKSEKILGWKAEKTIEDAIKDAWRWETNLSTVCQG